MTDPAWSGRGRDPWLPARLDARINVGEAERAIRRSFWSALSGWLVETGRRVLRGGRPDLDAIWARAPQWADAVDQVVRGSVAPAMGSAYGALLGDGFPWDQRPFATTYLAEVANRMVRIPDEVYDLVAGQVAQAVNLGENIRSITDRVDNVLSTTMSERWPNRATVVARTESIGALNAGRNDAFKAVAEETGLTFEKVWLATLGPRTRPSHAAADGQRVGLDDPFIVGGSALEFPGDPSGPAEEVIQCVPWGTVVQYPGLRNALRRRYQGQMVQIKLSTGDELTITPNHPVLRADGLWTPAGQLNEGDQLLSALLGGETTGQPYPGHVPAKIGKVYGASRLATMTHGVSLTPPDLHGDRPRGQVQVVAVDRDLGFNREPATDEEVRQLGLAFAYLAGTAGGCADRAPPVNGPVQADLPPASLMGRAGEGQPLGGAEPGHPEPVGLAGGADFQTERGQFADDGGAAGPQLPSHLLNALPTRVALAEVIRVDRYSFSGHVFNLDTGHGWYIANSIITRNCRCNHLLVEPGETTDMSNRQFLDE